jgi:hypothetical protein
MDHRPSNFFGRVDPRRLEGHHRAVRLWLGIFAATVAAVAACGARTGLPVDERDSGSGGAPRDAGHDAPPDVLDAGPDVLDAPPDVFDAPPDVYDCQDAGITYIYLIGNDNTLLKFYPPTKVADTIGVIKCPIAMPQMNPTPYSMAVDRQGIAYVVFTDGELFRVSTATASCEATGFPINQGGFSTEFGMGYSADLNDPGERLFVAGNFTMQLATIDTKTFKLTPLGTFSMAIGEAELTGTGGGDLYAFGLVIDVDGGMTSAIHLARIEKSTATVLGDAFLTVQSGTAQIFDWAFAYWGGNFYFFTSTDGSHSIVSRYIPGGPPNMPVVTTLGTAIVGAGVSTCAPQQ